MVLENGGGGFLIFFGLRWLRDHPAKKSSWKQKVGGEGGEKLRESVLVQVLTPTEIANTAGLALKPHSFSG